MLIIRLNFTFLQIFQDIYHFAHKRISKRSISPNDEYHGRLSADPSVSFSFKFNIVQMTTLVVSLWFLAQNSFLCQVSYVNPSDTRLDLTLNLPG